MDLAEGLVKRGPYLGVVFVRESVMWGVVAGGGGSGSGGGCRRLHFGFAAGIVIGHEKKRGSLVLESWVEFCEKKRERFD